MAQSAAELMETEQESLRYRLRNSLTSKGINTVSDFLRLNPSQIQDYASSFVAIMSSDPQSRRLNAAMMKILSLQSQGPPELFEPLVAVILNNKPNPMKTCIRSSKKISPTPQSPVTLSTRPTTSLDAPSNPVKTGMTSGIMNSSGQLNEFLASLKRELSGLTYINVPGLVQHFTAKQCLPSAFRLTPNESFIEERYTYKFSNKSEKTMLEWINSFYVQLKKQSPELQYSRAWRSSPTKPMKGTTDQRKIDGAIVSLGTENEHHIKNILVPFEQKNSEALAKDAYICLAKDVYEIFKHQPTRSFVVGLTLCGTSLQLWQFDRSGAIGSELLELKANRKNLEIFFGLMSFFLACDKEHLGFDPTFIENQGIRTVKIKIESTPETLIIDGLVFRASGICTRGTTCWKAHLKGSDQQKFLIKDSWQPTNRTKEGDMLCDVTNQKVPYVAQYYYHEDVQVDNKQVDIESHVRRGAAFKQPELAINFAETTSDKVVPNEFVNRVHRRLVLKDVGQPIWNAGCPIRLLKALEHCIKGHQGLLGAGYLHRDISMNNLMIGDTHNPDKNFLIDLDMAIPYNPTTKQERLGRTGTKLFMSIHLLANEEHSHDFVDDLESFFWVLLWICIHYPENQKKTSEVTKWNYYPLKTLGLVKSGALHTPG
ncbi:hypothetical protein PTTG_05909 [Puccinia triticina 1-1 BBBD Race 1]|uniref:Pkinase_fungal domain-containing protein n=1 Tax=Puccinia triticina (isolate 1-1 / race 1 (BBBD)) TaxID=630390 RepID=A0A180GWU8_PUCT1|nr:hypothetical protein PTTG_05909 [Puccinia triticina 1-1 BBBD Race 1]